MIQVALTLTWFLLEQLERLPDDTLLIIRHRKTGETYTIYDIKNNWFHLELSLVENMKFAKLKHFKLFLPDNNKPIKFARIKNKRYPIAEFDMFAGSLKSLVTLEEATQPEKNQKVEPKKDQDLTMTIFSEIEK